MNTNAQGLMPPDLLQTKLIIPPLVPGILPRPQLGDYLASSRDIPCTLVSAPAGFGKTTLISTWIKSQPDPAAWLSLDDTDNDKNTFIRYLTSSLCRCCPELSSQSRFSGDALQYQDISITLANLINAILDLPYRVILVLDDYHQIDNQEIHQAIGYLCQHLPANLRLFISTRRDPPLPLSILRASGKLVEIRTQQLAFTGKEIDQFIQESCGIALSQADLRVLENRSEGWAAGLRLIAHSLERSPDASRYISQLGGNQKLIADYLTDQVLSQIPEDWRDFVLETCLLKRLSGALCDHVRGKQDSQQILETLAAKNLFLHPLDEEHTWYRYHHLFSDLLNIRLQQTWPENVPSYHDRASAWFENQGLIIESIMHAINGEDMQRASKLINTHSEAIFDQGAFNQLHTLLRLIPDELIKPSIPLNIYAALAATLQGDYNKSATYMHLALEVIESEEQDTRHYQGMIELITAYHAHSRGEPQALELAQNAVQLIPETNTGWKCQALILLGSIHNVLGNLEEEEQAFLAAESCGGSNNSIYFQIASIDNLISIMIRNGRLLEAEEKSRKTLEIAANAGLSSTNPGAWLHTHLAWIYCERNQLDLALQEAARAKQILRNNTIPSHTFFFTLNLIRILFARKEFQEMDRCLQDLELLMETHEIPLRFTNAVVLWRIRYWLEMNHQLPELFSTIQSRLDQFQTYDHGGLMQIPQFLRIRLAVKQAIKHHGKANLEGAALEASQLALIFYNRGIIIRGIEAKILEALVYQTSGSQEKALLALGQALEQSQECGFHRLFLDEGPALVRLLYQAAQKGICPDYAGQLLAMAELEPGQAGAKAAASVEPLSEREIEVLKMLADGATNAEISSRLVITINTVKKHVSNILAKLNTTSRTQAAAVSRDLGLLD